MTETKMTELTPMYRIASISPLRSCSSTIEIILKYDINIINIIFIN